MDTKVKQNSLIIKSDVLKNCLELLLDNGFRIFKSYYKENENLTYFNYSKDNKIAYLQVDYFGGVKYSTVHKPCRDFGTGFGLCEESVFDLTIEDLEKGFIHHPNWAKGDTTRIKKYSSLDEFLKSSFSPDKLVEITK